mgnify:CR=1 FL=1
MKHKFSYMLDLDAVLELKQCGIQFVCARDPELEDEFPALILPSGRVLIILRDDEGNGPGSIQYCADTDPIKEG